MRWPGPRPCGHDNAAIRYSLGEGTEECAQRGRRLDGKPPRQVTIATDRGRPPDVKATRKILGVNQVVLAELLGVHPLTVSRWECGRSAPNPQQRALMQLMIDDPTIQGRLSSLIGQMRFSSHDARQLAPGAAPGSTGGRH